MTIQISPGSSRGPDKRQVGLARAGLPVTRAENVGGVAATPHAADPVCTEHHTIIYYLSTIYYEYLLTLQHPEVVCGDVEARVAARRVAGLQTQRRPAVARPGVDSPTTTTRHWGYGDIM